MRPPFQSLLLSLLFTPILVPLLFLGATALGVTRFLLVDPEHRMPTPAEARAVATARFHSGLETLDGAERKVRFFEQLAAIGTAENQRILEDRLRLAAVEQSFRDGTADESDLAWLSGLARDYDLPGDDSQLQSVELSESATRDALFAELRLRVDAVPLRLLLVQAAKESGWGRSRFARDGNNLFGQWCFEKGCGIVPGKRRGGATHEVARFPDLHTAVRAYLHNLNTNEHYAKLRALRAAHRSGGRPVLATSLLPGLLFYSERREAYLEDLAEMLRFNAPLLPRPGAALDLAHVRRG